MVPYFIFKLICIELTDIAITMVAIKPPARIVPPIAGTSYDPVVRPHLHRPFTRHPHKIYPAGQGADVNLGFGSGELAGDELLTTEVQDGEVTLGGVFNGYFGG